MRHSLKSISLLLVFCSVGFAVDLKDLKLSRSCAAIVTELDSRMELSAKDIVRNQVKILTVKKVGAPKKGRFGGKLIRVERIYQDWGSTYYAKSSFAPQGEPRGFIAAIGKSTALFFGFELDETNTFLTLPSVEEFSGAIRAANKILEENKSRFRINLDFANQEKTKYALTTYLKNYGEKGILPFSKELSHYIHDISNHTASIFYPEEVIERSKTITKFVLNLTQSLREAFPEDSPFGPHTLLLRKNLHFLRARQVDEGTGTFVSNLHNYVSNPKDKDPAFNLPLLLLNGVLPQNGQQTLKTTEAFWKDLTPKFAMDSMLKRVIDPAYTPLRLQPQSTHVEREQVRSFLQSEEFKKFFSKWESKQEKVSSYLKKPSLSFAETCALTSEKRLEIMRLVQAPESEKPTKKNPKKKSPKKK